MNSIKPSAQKKTNRIIKNPLEIDKQSQKGHSLLDSFFGQQNVRETYDKMLSEKSYGGGQKPQERTDFTVLYDRQVAETDQKTKREINELMAVIKQQVEQLKRNSGELAHEVLEVEKHALHSLPEKPGVYHVRFLELLSSFLQTLSTKVSEAKNWMAAMHTKKAKRGSLFAARSKKQGTQYSMSQEHSSARSVT